MKVNPSPSLIEVAFIYISWAVGRIRPLFLEEKMGSFYPHGKPGYYAYTKHFVAEYGGNTGYLAEANTKYPGIGSKGHSITIKALMNLKELINAARAAELAFLKDTGINLDDPNASNIFRSMNEIFNSKQTFERGLQYMKSIANSGENMKKGEMYRDVSRYFGTYLKKTLQTDLKKFLRKDIIKMSPGQIENLINDIIGNALVATYENVADFINKDTEAIRGKFGNSNKGKAKANENEKEVQAIKDMIQIIKRLQSTGAFKNYGHLFDLNLETLQEMTDRKDRRYKIKLNKKKYSGAHVDSNFGGNILELITTTVAAELGNTHIRAHSPIMDLTITGVHTGQMNQMKADTMLFVGQGPINIGDYLQYINDGFDSVRMQNVDAMAQYLEKLDSNLRHVIMISDKNYSIKANFGGINAQEKMDLQSAGMMLSQFGVGDIPSLINYLANCGDAMIQGQVNGEVRTELQSLIGYFLFDHLQINVSGSKPGPNVVNLMNVSGIYIPLSTYLEGIYNSLQDVASNPSSFVSVTISLGGETDQPIWTPGTWGAFRTSHETESFISYRIMRNIADFINGL